MSLRLTGATHCVTIRAILRQRTTRLHVELDDKVIIDCPDTHVDVLTLRGLIAYSVLFLIHLKSRRVEVAGIT